MFFAAVAQYIGAFFKHFAATIGVMLAIYATSLFGKRFFFFMRSAMGGPLFLIFFKVAFAIAGILILAYLLTRRKGSYFRKACATVLFLVIIFIIWKKVHIIEERLHYFEFGMLGWLAQRDLTRAFRRWGKAGWVIATVCALLLGAGVGITNELFQKIIPNRVCDVKDMIMDAKAAALGVIFNILS